MSQASFYHTLTDEELINYVDANGGTELERELADRMDVLKLDNQQLRIDLLNAERERDYERAV